MSLPRENQPERLRSPAAVGVGSALAATPPDPTSGTAGPAATEPVVLPITGELDLHTFRPRDVPELLEAYFAAARSQGLRTVRVVHGKGTGALRDLVHARLRSSPHVISWRGGDETSGGWGATLVALR